ncbi:hypothetical protein ACWEGE_16040 [Amycolatopsis sp. NPDC004747]
MLSSVAHTRGGLLAELGNTAGIELLSSAKHTVKNVLQGMRTRHGLI